jgi:hypothetical protein
VTLAASVPFLCRCRRWEGQCRHRTYTARISQMAMLSRHRHRIHDTRQEMRMHLDRHQSSRGQSTLHSRRRPGTSQEHPYTQTGVCMSRARRMSTGCHPHLSVQVRLVARTLLARNTHPLVNRLFTPQ